jgi:hypothetical protein
VSKWHKYFCMSLLTFKTVSVFTEYKYFSLHLFSMQLKKTLISFLLIFAYSIGFAHELIPHYHAEDGFLIGEKAELHHHVSPKDRDFDDIFHADHLDDSFLDFLVCIISHSEHSSHSNSEIIHQGIDTSIDKFIASDAIVLIENDENILVPYQKSTKVNSKPYATDWIGHSSVHSRRGPPKNS